MTSVFGSGFGGGGGGGGGITTPVSIANGGTGQTTANAAFNALAALTLGQSCSFALSDNLTNTSAIARVLKHTSSGTTAASFGVGDAVDLQSAAGNLRRVMTDVTALRTATDGGEEANRVFRLMVGGTLTDVATMTFVGNGAAPRFYLGPESNGTGILAVGNTALQLVLATSAVVQLSSTNALFTLPIQTSGKVTSSDTLKQGTNLTNADLSKDVSNGAEFTLPASTLTGSHTLTLAVTGSPVTNQIIRVTRLDATANTYVVKDDAATTLLTFPVSTKAAADFKYNGTHFVLDRYWLLN